MKIRITRYMTLLQCLNWQGPSGHKEWKQHKWVSVTDCTFQQWYVCCILMAVRYHPSGTSLLLSDHPSPTQPTPQPSVTEGMTSSSSQPLQTDSGNIVISCLGCSSIHVVILEHEIVYPDVSPPTYVISKKMHGRWRFILLFYATLRLSKLL